MADDQTVNPEIDINSVHDVQVARLDAEMFAADDIDGVTEGLTGSGNLNYLILQSQQTDEATQNIDPFNLGASSGDGAGGIAAHAGAGGQPGALPGGGFAGPYAFASDLSDALSLLNAPGPDSRDPDFGTADGGGSGGGALGGISAAAFSTAFNDSGESFSFFRESNGSDGLNGIDGPGGAGGNDGVPGPIGEGTPGTPGAPGTPGQDGVSPPPPGGGGDDDDYDLIVNLDSDILTLNLDVILDPLENIIGDIDIKADVILGDLLSFDDGILPNPSVILDALIGDNQLLDQLQIDVILTPVENLLTGVVDAINPVLGGLLPFLPDPLTLVNDLLGSFNSDGDTDLVLNVDLGLPDLLGFGGIGAVGAHIPLDPVEALLGDIDIDLDINAALQDLLEGGLSIPNIEIGLLSGGEVLEGVEILISTDDLVGDMVAIVDDVLGDELIGDVVGVVDDLTEDLLGESPVGDVVEGVENILGHVGDALSGDDPLGDLVGGDVIGNLTGGLLDGLLGGGDGGGGGNPDGDTDLTIDTGLAIGDAVLENIDLDVTLDLVENIVGDIDIDINLNTDVVNEILSGDIDGAIDDLLNTVDNLIDIHIDLFNPEAGQDGGIDLGLGGLVDGVIDDLGSWPEATIGDVVGDVLDLGGDMIGDILPEPDGIVSEGLNLIGDVLGGGGSGGGGLLGGLGGGGGLGGLFG